MSLSRWTGLVVAVATSLAVGLAARAQTIWIPDFNNEAPNSAMLKPGESCMACGRILSIREIQVQRQPVIPQAFQSAGPRPSPGLGGRNLVGAVIYLPLGNKANDSSARPFVGGVGTPEMRERFRESTYEITVRMADGATRFVQRHDGSRYRVGDRVRLLAPGELEVVYDQ